jgi:hypothetical protein
MGALGMFQGYPINKLAECADHSDSADSLGLFGHRRVLLFISDAFMQPDQLTDAMRNRPAVLVTEAVLQTFADSGGAGFAGGFEDFEAVGGADPLEDGSVGEFGEGVAEDALIGGAVVEAMAFGVDEGDQVGGVFGDDAEEFVAVGGAAVGEVDPE